MSQNTQILEYLKQGNRITPIDALSKFGCFRLSGRILELRRLGYDIKADIVAQGKKHFAEYYI